MRAHRTSMLIGLIVMVAFSCGTEDPRVPTKEDAVGLGRLLKDSIWIVDAIKKNRDRFVRPAEEPLTADERAEFMPIWAAIIDHDLAFDSYQKHFLNNGSRLKEQSGRDRALIIGYAAYVAQLREFLAVLGATRDREVFAVAFNEEALEFGISAGHYERILWRTASPETYLTLSIVSSKVRKRKASLEAEGNADDARLIEIAEEVLKWSDDVTTSYETYGPQIMEQVAVKMATNEVNQIIKPIQTDIALWLGDTRVRQSDRSLISKENLDTLLPMLEPGDVFIERRNWYLSNLGLPGFWPHAAFFVGSPEELTSFFDADAEVLAQFPIGFSQHLETNYPDAWKHYVELDDEGEKHRVIEAISEGVVFTSLYHSALADYLGVMRPMRSKLERAYAVENTFQHHGKPYDFDFSFLSLAELVCSELVWVSYQLTSEEGRGLNLTTSTVLGRVTLPPTDIVKQFDAEYGSAEQQLDFVAFLDGDESSTSAKFETLEAFRESWKRPKWDLSQE